MKHTAQIPTGGFITRSLLDFPAPQFIDGDAEIRGDHKEYRYQLRRWWNPDPSWCMWLMLNPSTADAKLNDATIRRCMRFAYLWGHDGIIVVNLFAWRARNPKDLLTPGIDPIGPDNDEFIRESAIRSDRWICGWGATPFATTRAEKVALRLWDPQCLGVTKTGEPRHPLMLPYSVPLQPFAPVTDLGKTQVQR